MEEKEKRLMETINREIRNELKESSTLNLIERMKRRCLTNINWRMLGGGGGG